jgi:outer membrane lipopolysaccharide assembly protein LptE/RlpB
MSKTGSLILLLSLSCLFGCGYSFVLENTKGTNQFALLQTKNETSLIGGTIKMNTQLEKALSSMGMLSSSDKDVPNLKCTIQSATTQEITSSSKSLEDRYRLILQIKAEVLDKEDKPIWGNPFTGEGIYTAKGREEDALEEACKDASLKIARAIACLPL